MLPRLSGLLCDDTEARLLGRLLGVGTPNERRLVPKSGPPLTDETAEACDVRFRLLRSVTLLGM